MAPSLELNSTTIKAIAEAVIIEMYAERLIQKNGAYKMFTASALALAPDSVVSSYQIHSALDSYTNKANWKASITSLPTASEIYTEFTTGTNADAFKAYEGARSNYPHTDY